MVSERAAEMAFDPAASRRLELNPRQLHHFEVLAEMGSPAKACRFLGIGQSALTQSLSRLEAELGAELFDRSTRPARLAPAGRHLLDYLRRQNVEMDTLREKLAMEQGHKAGILRIGCGPRWMVDIVPRALNALLKAFPGMRVSIMVDQMARLSDRMEQGEVGIVFGTLDSLRLYSHYKVIELGVDRFVVVARKGHPLLARRAIPLAELTRQSWIIGDPMASSTTVLRQLLREAGLPPIIPTVELSDTLAVASTIRQTDCIGIFSASTARNLAEIETLSIDFEMPVSRSGAIYVEGRELSEAERALIDLVGEAFDTIPE